MADSWIKMRVTLATCPKVVRIASALNADGLRGPLVRTLVVGALHATWSLADTHTEDGMLAGYTPEVLDALVGVDGWTDALASVGWAVVSADGIAIPAFSDHNGASAKRRAKEQRRKADERDASAKRPKFVRTQCGQDADQSNSHSLSSSHSYPSGEGVQGEGPRERPGPDAERVPQPPGIGARLADVLEAEVEPLTDRAMALIVRLDSQTREARAASKRGMGSEMGSSAWRKAIALARSDPDAFEAQVELTEARSAANLQDPEDAAAPRKGQPFEKLTAREQQARRFETEAEKFIREYGGPDGRPLLDDPRTQARIYDIGGGAA